MVFNAGGSGRVWPPGGGQRSIGWPNGWTEKNATWPNGWKTRTATWSPPSNWRVRGSDGRMAQCAWMSYKRAGSILNWSGHESVRFSIVQSLDCLRTAGSVRFLFFFFSPPDPERGPRSCRGSIGIDRWPPRSLARESIVGTDDERSPIVRYAISLKAKERRESRKRSRFEVDGERSATECSIGHRRAEGENQDSRRDSWRSTRRVSKWFPECARPPVSAFVRLPPLLFLAFPQLFLSLSFFFLSLRSSGPNLTSISFLLSYYH